MTHGVSKVGRGSRFAADHLDGTGDDSTTQAHVGPGSYEPRRTNGGGEDSISRRAAGLRDGGLASASIVSESAQRPMSADLW